MSVDRLNALLEEERKCLLAGDLIGAHDLIAEKEALITAPLSREDLAAIRERLQRNGRLLQAAAEGIRRAQERIAELRAGTTASHVYGRDGARQPMHSKGRLSTRS